MTGFSPARPGSGTAPAPAPRPPPEAEGLRRRAGQGRSPCARQPQNVDSSVRFTVAYTVPLLDVLANDVTLRLPVFEVNAQV